MVTVLFFAKLREELQCSELHLEIDQPVALDVLKDLIGKKVDGATNQICNKGALCAINQSIVGPDAGITVKNGDEVAFFPPVTGG